MESASSGPVPGPVQPQVILEELLKLQAQEEEQTDRIGRMEAEERKTYLDIERQIENLERQRNETEARHAEERRSLRGKLQLTTNQKKKYQEQLYAFYQQERSEARQELILQTGDTKFIGLLERDQHSQELEKLLGERTDGYDVHLPFSVTHTLNGVIETTVYTLNRAIDNLLQMNCPFLTGKRDKQGVPHYVLNGKELVIVDHLMRGGYSVLLAEVNTFIGEQYWKYTQDVFIRKWYSSPRGTVNHLKMFYREPGSSAGLEVLGLLLQQEVAHLMREQEIKEDAERRRSDCDED